MPNWTQSQPSAGGPFNAYTPPVTRRTKIVSRDCACEFVGYTDGVASGQAPVNDAFFQFPDYNEFFATAQSVNAVDEIDDLAELFYHAHWLSPEGSSTDNDYRPSYPDYYFSAVSRRCAPQRNLVYNAISTGEECTESGYLVGNVQFLQQGNRVTVVTNSNVGPTIITIGHLGGLGEEYNICNDFNNVDCPGASAEFIESGDYFVIVNVNGVIIASTAVYLDCVDLGDCVATASVNNVDFVIDGAVVSTTGDTNAGPTIVGLGRINSAEYYVLCNEYSGDDCASASQAVTSGGDFYLIVQSADGVIENYNFSIELPGDPCPDDNNPCTDEGVLSATCDCVSTLRDSDGDGVCDLYDLCEGFDDAIDSDGDGIPDGCDADCAVCDSNGSDTSYEHIQNVNFGYESNFSGDNGGYGDFTGNVWDMYCGYWYGLALNPGFSNYAYWEHWSVWIDWNQDCDFDDVDEFVGQARYWGNIYGYVSVPDHALEGEATMRISMNYDNYSGSCDNFEYGEVEDYAINVICATGNGNAPLTAMSENEANRFQEAQAAHEEAEYNDQMLRPGYIGTQVDRNPVVTLAKSLQAGEQILVYPNPATDLVNVLISTLKEIDSVNVYDHTGKSVYQSATINDNSLLTIDVSEFAAGIYSVSIEGNNEIVETKRFVVTK